MLDWDTDVRTILQEVITETPPRPPRSRLFGFAAASGSLVLVFVAAGTPIPLYTTYRLEDGLTHGDLAAAAAVYLIAAAFALLVLGRLSDHLGRRPVAVVALVLAAAGMGVLLTVDSAAPLLLGRTMQGLATGIATSTLGAYAIDTAPTRPHWLAAVTTSAAPMLGIPSGALLAGALVDHGPDPRHLTFSILLGALLFAYLSAQSNGLQRVGIAPQIIDITQGTVVLAVVIAYEVVRRTQARREQEAVSADLRAGKTKPQEVAS